MTNSPTISKQRTGIFAKQHGVYTMPAGVDFLAHLAQGLLDELGGDLHTALILLPTRRAVRELSEQFSELSGGTPMLMPVLRTLADMDENEPPFSAPFATLGEFDPNLIIAPAMDGVRYQFELARLITHKMRASGHEIDAAGALAMAAPLLQLLTDFDMEELDISALSALDDKLADLPEHLQGAAEFVKIMAIYWPERLRELGLTSPMGRRVALLKTCSALWQANPPSHPVIIAGSTGSVRASARLMKTVAGLPKGLVVLPGLDSTLDDQAWDNIRAQHPQSALKNLIGYMDIARQDIPNWPDTELPFALQMRARIVSESLIPADTTSDWPARIERVRASVSRPDALEQGFAGLSQIDARSDEEEAAIAALILREVLETPNQTGALITPDPSLARRVRAKLSRFGIEIDSSAGEPLEETAHGAFAAQCLDLALDPFNPAVFCDVVGHGLFHFGDATLSAYEKRAWGRFEVVALRGVRATTQTQIQERIDQRIHKINQQKTDDQGEIDLIQTGMAIYRFVREQLAAFLTQGIDPQSDQSISVAAMTRAHIGFIEAIGGGAGTIWFGEAGEKSAQVFTDLMQYGDLLPQVNGLSYQGLLSQMMRSHVVRPRFGVQSRIRVLGPLEARMLHADVVILGGLNEGVWPSLPPPHPVLSRDMRLAVGLGVEEKRFGLAAHDFSQAALAKRVIMTRSKRSADQPSVPSRWLWRLRTFEQGARLNLAKGEQGTASLFQDGSHYIKWAQALDHNPVEIKPASAPEPRPPIADRWPKGRGLSVTKIKTWIRDPYSIYARTILGIEALDDLDEKIGANRYGTALHVAFEKLDTALQKSERGETADGVQYLQDLIEQELLVAGYAQTDLVRLSVRVNGVAKWMVKWAMERRELGWSALDVERRREATIHTKTSDQGFVLNGMADRVEGLGSSAAVIDFKTGGVPGIGEVLAGFDPQLPLLAFLFEQGQAKRDISEMLYVKPSHRPTSAKKLSVKHKDKSTEEIKTDALEELKKLIENFDQVETAYHSQPRAKFTNVFGQYDQLARRDEWAKLVEEKRGGG